MRRTAVFIVLSSILFLGIFLPQQRFTRYKTSHTFTLWGLPHGHSPGVSLWRALVTGDDSGLKKADKKTYYRLGLGHLFTPSGVHLSSLGPLLNVPGLTFLIALFSACIPQLLALARVGWIKIIPISQHHFLGFAVILLLEGCLWSWDGHAVSWTCSWLFLGLSIFAPKSQKMLWFMLGQLVLCWALMQPFSLLSPLANLIAEICMMLLFPLVLGLSFIPHFVLHQWVAILLDIFHQGVLRFDGVHAYLPALQPHAGHILFLTLWLCLRGKRRRWLALCCLLLSSPLDGVKKANHSMSRWEVVPFKSAVYLGGGRYSDGVHCKWKEGLRCRPPSGGRQKKLKKLSLKRSTSQKSSLRG